MVSLTTTEARLQRRADPLLAGRKYANPTTHLPGRGDRGLGTAAPRAPRAGLSAIRAIGLSKRYGDTLALDALDLEVREGEVYGYLGPNGAGKTTTIRLLLGLHRPSSGRGELFGVDAWADPVTAHRRVAYVAGEPFLWQLVGSLLGAPRWLADLTPFAHVGLVPTQSFRVGAAVAMLAIGALSALAAIGIFRRRDLLGA
jgi:hypothetical protein